MFAVSASEQRRAQDSQSPEPETVPSIDVTTQFQAPGPDPSAAVSCGPGRSSAAPTTTSETGPPNLYTAFYVATGEALGRIIPRHRSDAVPASSSPRSTARRRADLALHLIVDNSSSSSSSSTHTTEAIRDFLAAHPCFHLHFTPTSASWLNTVETWFGQLERRALRPGAFTTVTQLRDAIRRFIEAHNAHAANPFRWTKSAQIILDAIDHARDTMQRNFPCDLLDSLSGRDLYS